jgi:uncharacterized protein YjbI with pentapeptide repeats
MSHADNVESRELQYCDFHELDFRGSDFRGANFAQCDLRGAVFDNALTDFGEQLDQLVECLAEINTLEQQLLNKEHERDDALEDAVNLKAELAEVCAELDTLKAKP